MESDYVSLSNLTFSCMYAKRNILLSRAISTEIVLYKNRKCKWNRNVLCRQDNTRE